jgi:hypothetical protein
MIRPFLDGLDAANRVDHGIPLRQITTAELGQVRHEWRRNEIVERLDDPIGLALGKPESRSHSWNYRLARNRLKQIIK